MLGAAPASAAPQVVGLADQRAASLGDPRLTDLPVRHARLVVAWDAMRERAHRREVAAWMRSAEAAGLRVLVTFGASRRRTGRLPAVDDYKRLTAAFRRRHPGVREYSPWNEPNVARRRQGNDPRRIAAFYRVLRAGCPSCTVLGADVVDGSSLAGWMRAYLREFAPGRAPRAWGLHNYVDVHTHSSWGTRTMLRLTRGELWLTETGAVYRRSRALSIPSTDRRRRMRIGHGGAPEAMRRVFRLAYGHPRIRRVYVYHWRASADSRWDSGLLSPEGRPRRAFDVFAREVRRAARRTLAARPTQVSWMSSDPPPEDPEEHDNGKQ